LGEHTEELTETGPGMAAVDQDEKKTLREFGNAALAKKDTYSIYEPIKRGIIEDWENM
jgi:actin-related protein